MTRSPQYHGGDLPVYRQVHLDFHTPPDYRGVAERFDADVFGDTFADAAVAAVNVFAKCHHGYTYYPSHVGTQHPGLSRDLLGEQLRALHSRGIAAPIYISVMWDDLAGIRHPEWIIAKKDGSLLMRPPLTHGSPSTLEQAWTTLDVASGYRDYLFALVEEICANYPVDGFWFDITWPEPNYAPWAQERAKALGVDLSDDAAMRQLATRDLEDFSREMTALVLRHAPKASIFYNGGMSAGADTWSPYMTRLEIESLPTTEGVWGYMHYPVASRFIRTLGMPTVGMTGRFHKSWADFGGLKTTNQLEYEAGTILGGGSAISVGDQLDPSGVLDPAVYRTVGSVFSRVRDLEPWLIGSRPLTEAAILLDRRLEQFSGHETLGFSDEVEGAAQMLFDLHIQFDIVDPEYRDLDDYRLIIVPDGLHGTGELRRRLEASRAAGAGVVISGRGAADGGGFGPLRTPARITGDAEITPAYITPGTTSVRFRELADDYGYVFYDRVHLLEPKPGVLSLGQVHSALYQRSWEHFFGHLQAPAGEPLDTPWAVLGDSVACLAAPLFGAYRRHDYWAYKALFSILLDRLLPDPLVRTSAPAWIETDLHAQQTEEGITRSIVHLTAFTSRRSLSSVPRVDEGARFADVVLDVACAREPRAAYLAPRNEPVDLEWRDGYARMRLPPIGTHTVLVVES